MFRTAIKTLSLFRKVRNTNYRYSYVHSNLAFRKIEQPKLYNDALNIFMLSAFVKESVKNTNNFKKEKEKEKEKQEDEDTNTRPVNNDDCEYCIKHKNYNNSGQGDKDLKIMCQITGREKRKNNVDCSCYDKCIVEKSETSIVSDLL